MGLLAVFVAPFFVFRNSGRKVLRLVGTPVNRVRSGMGTETTSATYRRTQNPRATKLFCRNYWKPKKLAANI